MQWKKAIRGLELKLFILIVQDVDSADRHRQTDIVGRIEPCGGIHAVWRITWIVDVLRHEVNRTRNIHIIAIGINVIGQILRDFRSKGLICRGSATEIAHLNVDTHIIIECGIGAELERVTGRYVRQISCTCPLEGAILWGCGSDKNFGRIGIHIDVIASVLTECSRADPAQCAILKGEL